MRVLEAAETLGFRPNRLARALATSRSQTIGVVVHDAADPYFAQIIRGLEDVLEEHDHALFVASSDREPATELVCIRNFLSHQVDAIVLAASGIDDSAHLDEFRTLLDGFVNKGGKVVCLSDHPYPAPKVELGNREVAMTATAHLIGLGHSRIAFLAGPHNLFVTANRQEGYEAALRTAGIPFTPDLVFAGDFTLESGRLAAEWLLSRPDVTGVVAANDLMGIGIIRGLLERSVPVPEAVSVVGIDDIPFTEYAPVPLTSVRIPLTELGHKGGHMVMGLLAGNELENDRLTHHLVTRASTTQPLTLSTSQG